MGFKYNILSNDELKTIHNVSLEILENIGVRIPHNKVLEILYSNGVRLDKKRKIVKFHPEIVLKAIEIAGKKHTLYGSDKKNRAEFGYDMLNFNGSSGQYQIIDQKNSEGESRQFVI